MVSAMSRCSGTRSACMKARAAASSSRTELNAGALPNMTIASCGASSVECALLAVRVGRAGPDRGNVRSR